MSKDSWSFFGKPYCWSFLIINTPVWIGPTLICAQDSRRNLKFEIESRLASIQNPYCRNEEQLWSTVMIISTLSTAKAQCQSHWAWVWSGLTCSARKSTTSVRIYSVYLTKGTQHWTPQDKSWDICHSSTPLGFIWPPVIWSCSGNRLGYPSCIEWGPDFPCLVGSSNGVATPEDDQDPTNFTHEITWSILNATVEQHIREYIIIMRLALTLASCLLKCLVFFMSEVGRKLLFLLL